MKIRAALLMLVVASGCGQHDERYGVLQDAGLSADGRTLLVLVEHGTTTTDHGGLWMGDITTKHPESLKIHEFDRGSGRPGRVLDYPQPAGSLSHPLQHVEVYAAKSGIQVSPLPECREFYT